MLIRTTHDPMTDHDVPSPEQHPCVYEGDGDNGIVIYFESEQSRQEYLDLQPHDPKILQGSDSEEYVAEG